MSTNEYLDEMKEIQKDLINYLDYETNIEKKLSKSNNIDYILYLTINSSHYSF